MSKRSRPPPRTTHEILEIITPLFTSIDPLPPSASREEIDQVLFSLGYRDDEEAEHVDQMGAPERNENVPNRQISCAVLSTADVVFVRGGLGDRTPDPRLAKPMLSH